MLTDFAELLIPILGEWNDIQDDVYLFSRSYYAELHPEIIPKVQQCIDRLPRLTGSMRNVTVRCLLKVLQETELDRYIDNEDLDAVIIACGDLCVAFEEEDDNIQQYHQAVSEACEKLQRFAEFRDVITSYITRDQDFTVQNLGEVLTLYIQAFTTS